MQWQEFKEKLRIHRMSQAGFARMTGQHVTTVNRWKDSFKGCSPWVGPYFQAYEGQAPGQKRALLK